MSKKLHQLKFHILTHFRILHWWTAAPSAIILPSLHVARRGSLCKMPFYSSNLVLLHCCNWFWTFASIEGPGAAFGRWRPPSTPPTSRVGTVCLSSIAGICTGCALTIKSQCFSQYSKKFRRTCVWNFNFCFNWYIYVYMFISVCINYFVLS